MFLKRIIKDVLALIVPRQKGISILMYHSVAHNNVFFTVKPEIFEKQMKYLKDKDYNVIKLSDSVSLLESNKELPRKTVVLTFDDGFEDNYINVFPVLNKYNFPATIFLITGLVNKEMNNSQNIPLKILNWDQIQEMHESGLIDFQPHTVNHQEINKEEIINSKKEIEERLNKRCEFFAYPRGVYNNEIIEILKNNGFKASRTVKNGKVNKGDDLFKLKKISVNSTTSFIQFKANL